MLGFVVPTVGRWRALDGLLGSLDAVAAHHPVCAVVVDQSGQDRGPDLPPLAHLHVDIVQDAGRGASRARNLGLAALDPVVTHVAWPNDHSEYPVASVRALLADLPAADVVVGQLVEAGAPRYGLPPARAPIDQRTVWAAIEPATALSVALTREVGGWSEQLGAGALSPWQSSALADLLLRMSDRARVRWDPDVVVHGPGFVRGASGPELTAKVRAYGRGYGRVLASWDYPWWRRVGSVVKPLLVPGYRVGPDQLPWRARVGAAVGRAEGLTGHLLPGSETDLRAGRDLVAH